MPKIKKKQHEEKKPREKKFHRKIRLGVSAFFMGLATLYYLQILEYVSGLSRDKVGWLFIVNTIWITAFIYWWGHIKKS